MSKVVRLNDNCILKLEKIRSYESKILDKVLPAYNPCQRSDIDIISVALSLLLDLYKKNGGN